MSINVATEARDFLLGLLAEEDQAEELALWLDVTGAEGERYTYDLYFARFADAGPGDLAQDDGELRIVVSDESVAKVAGATLEIGPGGDLVILNPNRPPTGPVGDLGGELAQRVLKVLALRVNPQIAAHGGRAELVAVEDATAYLRLSGGCQGCGMASVTLSQGIEVAIKDEVPEIASIIDVTDHAGGSNPYYEAAKK